MLNNFIYAQSKAMFEEQIAEVPNEAIVFIEDTKEIWTHGTYFDCSTLDPSIIPNIQTEIDELRMSFNNKADADGSYPDMTVGFAEDLGGAEFTQESEFTIRATADGKTVKDGAARIESIKGNTVVWNQLIKASSNAYVQAEGDVAWTVIYSLTDIGWGAIANNIPLMASHRYYIIYQDLSGKLNNDNYILVNGDYLVYPNDEKIITYAGEEGEYYVSMRFTPESNGARVRIMMFDLTKMFGAGNEPATVEEFYARIPMGMDMNTYNEGEVVHMDKPSIKSVGVNQWDEEWEIGSLSGDTGLPVDGQTTIRSKNFIPVISGEQYFYQCPATGAGWVVCYDSEFNPVEKHISTNIYKKYLSNIYKNTFTIPQGVRYIKFYVVNTYGTTYNHDICININNASVNGKYFPYAENVKDLSIIHTYFPDGMKSAGNVYDEIRYNKATGKWEVIKRINGRAYQAGDTDNESYLTNGQITYYPLAESIITEIEDPGFSYQVWNGGTEQIVASNSAPFKADITYNFSANEWIKQNRFDIEKLNTSLGTYYGVCDTATDATVKTVTVSGNFSLVTGAQVVVKFTNGNTANMNRLNVNNTGAKNITTGYGKSFNINAQSILTLEYDGTSWVVISSNQMITSGNNNGYTLQTINSQTSGLAIANGVSVLDSVDGDLYIAHGGTNENAIYCTAGNIVTATGAVQGNIVHNTRTITATTTLDAKDNIVLCQNTSDIVVNIDTSKMTSGQVITLIKETPNQVTVRTKNGSGASVNYLKTFGSSVATRSGEALSAVGIWNIYCVGSYIYLYKL